MAHALAPRGGMALALAPALALALALALAPGAPGALAKRVGAGDVPAAGDEVDWMGAATLDESSGYTVRWAFDADFITFEVSAATTGWIALGASPNGAMGGADITVAWVDADGEAHVSDRFAPNDAEAPVVDADTQDAALLYASEVDGVTTVAFTKPRASCDLHDASFPDGATTRVIWAYGLADLEHENADMEGHYHGPDRRGTRSIVYTQPLDAERARGNADPDATSVDLVYPGAYTMSEGVDTDYYCSLFTLPDVGSKHHITEFEVLVDERNKGRVHHMLLFDCTEEIDELLADEGVASLDDLGGGKSPHMSKHGHCNGGRWTSSRVLGCNGDRVMSFWGVGGGSQVFPAEAGFPFGPGEARHVLVEWHYDNPGGTSWADDSAVRVRYTPNLRPNDVGVFAAGVETLPGSLTIPGETVTHEWAGWCPSACLSSRLDKPVNIVSIALHTHTTGYYVSTRLVRDGREVAIVGEDPYYDFDMQINRILPEPIELRPTDSLFTTCRYTTVGRGPVQMGVATSDEMCLSYLTYWPRAEKFTNCKELPDTIGWRTGTKRSGCDGMMSGVPFIDFNAPAIEPLADDTCGRWCGDGMKEGTELCDDGNQVPGDGCDQFCGIENGWECTEDADGLSACAEAKSSTEVVEVCNLDFVWNAQGTLGWLCGWWGTNAATCAESCTAALHSVLLCYYDSSVRLIAGNDPEVGLLKGLNDLVRLYVDTLGSRCATVFDRWDACEVGNARCYGGPAAPSPPAPPSGPHFAHGKLDSEDLLVLDRLDSALNYERHVDLPELLDSVLHYNVNAGSQKEGGYIDFKLEAPAIWATAYIGFATEAPMTGGAIGVVAAIDHSRPEGAKAAYEATVYEVDSLEAFSHGKFDHTRNHVPLSGDLAHTDKVVAFAYAEHPNEYGLILRWRLPLAAGAGAPETLAARSFAGYVEEVGGGLAPGAATQSGDIVALDTFVEAKKSKKSKKSKMSKKTKKTKKATKATKAKKAKKVKKAKKAKQSKEKIKKAKKTKLSAKQVKKLCKGIKSKKACKKGDAKNACAYRKKQCVPK